MCSPIMIMNSKKKSKNTFDTVFFAIGLLRHMYNPTLFTGNRTPLHTCVR